MKSIWVLTRKELTSYFDSLIAYVILILFLILTGYLTWLSNSNIFFMKQADLRVFFEVSYLTLFIFIPAITMRTLAEENRAGTIELLSTKAINDWEIVLGKFLSSLLLIVIALLCTLPYYFSVAKLGNIDHGAVIGGYLGLILLSAAYISLGIFASSLTNNQIIALLFGWIMGALLFFLFGFIGSGLGSGSVSTIFDYLNARTHYDSMARGVIDSKDLIYFFSIILGGLVLAQSMLSKRNWHD